MSERSEGTGRHSVERSEGTGQHSTLVTGPTEEVP
jgi:hypothetical protein